LSSKRDQSSFDDQATMSFGDHLEDLRKRILLALVVPLPLSVIAFFFSNTLIDLLVLPLYRVLAANGLPPQVQALSPPEVVVTQLKLSVIAAIVLSAPWMLWQAWKFISPGLYKHERRFVHFLIPGSAILTLCGIALMYFGMLPLMLRVLVLLGSSLHISGPAQTMDPRIEAVLKQPNLKIELRYSDPQPLAVGQAWLRCSDLRLFVAVEGGSPGAVIPLEVPKINQPLVAQVFRLADYIGFVLLLLLGIVIAFQMPLVVVLLGWVGIVRADWLRKQRKYAFFICAIVAIVITPPDVVSMLIMLLPLYGLYELGILLLVIAPASAVAEGRVFSLRRLSRDDGAGTTPRRDKSQSQPAQAHRAAQADRTIAQDAQSEQVAATPADGKGNEP
jgi:sec-independent protein translocase protein TatC